MAFYISIFKENEDDISAVYSFGPDKQLFGKLRIDKTSGVVQKIESVPSDDSDIYFARAATKIRQHWREGNLPNKTFWVS